MWPSVPNLRQAGTLPSPSPHDSSCTAFLAANPFGVVSCVQRPASSVPSRGVHFATKRLHRLTSLSPTTIFHFFFPFFPHTHPPTPPSHPASLLLFVLFDLTIHSTYYRYCSPTASELSNTPNLHSSSFCVSAVIFAILVGKIGVLVDLLS